MNIQPITNEDEHAAALRLVDTLADAADGTEEAHACDALITLIDAYERKAWPLDDEFDPVGLVRQAMSPEVGHSRADLVRIIGSASRVSEILAKRRALTIDMIRSISEAWGIPAELLMQKYEVETSSTLSAAARQRPATKKRPAARELAGT